MDFQRIFILAGLAVTAYLLVLAWNEDYGQGRKPAVRTEASGMPGHTEIPDRVVPDAEAGTDIIPRLDPGQARPDLSRQQQQRELIQVSTDVLTVRIDPVGGDIVHVALPAYPANLETPDIPFVLLDPGNGYVAQSGLIGPDGTDRSGSRPHYQVGRFDFDMGAEDTLTVPLELFSEDGSQIIKKYTFTRGDYLVKVDFEVTNKGSTNWQAGLFAQIKRDSRVPANGDSNVMGMQPYVGGATRSESELYKKLDFDDVGEADYRAAVAGGYIALVQHYFVSAFVPTQREAVNYSARKLQGRDIYLFGFTTPASIIPPGQTGVLDVNLYMGPKDQYRLKEIASGLDLTVDYGFLWWLAQPLFYLLTAIHGFFPNWGVAIIFLTIIVKLLLYPLSATSFRSMAKMRKLQPEMTKLKERYGEDRQQFSQAMMTLYKKEGANPLGGCFPVLLQMPVFLALYWTLLESVELRHAPFVLWIDDLSAMDPFFVLPILMGISMYLTQAMQPEPPDPIQAKVFKFMPIMFTFFFLWFPSGLVLYWLVNNILSILQQWYVTRQLEKNG